MVRGWGAAEEASASAFWALLGAGAGAGTAEGAGLAAMGVHPCSGAGKRWGDDEDGGSGGVGNVAAAAAAAVVVAAVIVVAGGAAGPASVEVGPFAGASTADSALSCGGTGADTGAAPPSSTEGASGGSAEAGLGGLA